MTEEITVEVFDHLVELAALELTPEEADYLRRQLNNQLKAIHELTSIPLDLDTPIAAHGVPYTMASTPTLREDAASPHPDPAKLLSGAPDVEDGYIIVPETPHQDLK